MDPSWFDQVKELKVPVLVLTEGALSDHGPMGQREKLGTLGKFTRDIYQHNTTYFLDDIMVV